MRTIVAAIDFSDVTDAVLRIAAEQARAFGARLRLLHVADADGAFVGYDAANRVERDLRAEDLHHDHRALIEHAERLRAGGLDVRSVLVEGPTVDTIVEQAADLGADLVVVGSHGHGSLYQALLGSVSAGVVREARCPVLVVPSRR